MKRAIMNDNWKKKPKKLKINEPKSLFELSENVLCDRLNYNGLSDCLILTITIEGFTYYTNSYLLSFLKTWLKKISKSQIIVINSHFTDWLKNIDYSEFNSDIIEQFIGLMKILLNSPIKNHCFDNVKVPFINILCKFYHNIVSEYFKIIIANEIYNNLVKDDCCIISWDKELLLMANELFSSENIENQLLGLKYYTFMIKQFESANFYTRFILNKLTEINQHLLGEDFNTLSKIKTKLVYQSIFLSQILLRNEKFRNKESKWISNNLMSFFHYKKLFGNKNLLALSNSPAVAIINCLSLCLISMSANEIYSQFSEAIDAMLSLPTDLILEFGFGSKALNSSKQSILFNNEQVISHLSDNLSQYQIQESFLYSVRKFPCKLTQLQILTQWNKTKLSTSVIEQIYNSFEICLNDQSDTTNHTQLLISIAQILTSNFTAKFTSLTNNKNPTGIHEFMLSLYSEKSRIVPRETWLPFFQVPINHNNNDNQLSPSIDDDYILNYVSMLSYMSRRVFDRIIDLALSGDISIKKRCLGALYLLVDCNDLTIIFLSEIHLREIYQMFSVTLAQDDSNNSKAAKDLKIFLKIFFRFLDLIFKSKFCYDKCLNLLNGPATDILSLIGNELCSNKLKLRKYFMKNRNYIETILNLIFASKKDFLSPTKKYFEKLRFFIKSGLKISNTDQKALLKDFAISNLRCLAGNLTVSEIPEYHFLFSLKNWCFEGLIVPSTKIFIEGVVNSFNFDLITRYSILEFIDLFYSFFFSLLNLRRKAAITNEINEIYDETVKSFVQFAKVRFNSNVIRKLIFQINFSEERDYFKLWILLGILREPSSSIPKDVQKVLIKAVKNIDLKSNVLVVSYDLFYWLFENVLLISESNANANISTQSINNNTSTISIVKHNQYYKEKFINYYEKHYKFHKCAADRLNSANDTVVFKLPSKFKMTFKVNFDVMMANSHYFEAFLSFSKDVPTIIVDISEDFYFYSPDKEEAVKYAFKIIVHLLHGCRLSGCGLISTARRHQLLNSSLMICLYINDRLQLKAEPRICLFDFIFHSFFLNVESPLLHDEISYAINYVVKSGCIYLYSIILEVILNHMKYWNSDQVAVRTNKSVITAVIRSTCAHIEWFGADLCMEYLINFLSV